MRELAKRDQALERIKRERALSDVWEHEQKRFEHIMDLALMAEDPGNRWERYEQIKKMTSKIVGWEASHNVLRTQQHYAIVLDFVDWLLPSVDPEAQKTMRGRFLESELYYLDDPEGRELQEEELEW